LRRLHVGGFSGSATRVCSRPSAGARCHGLCEKPGRRGVRIFSQAPPETLEQFIERLKNPPPPAVVKQLEVREAKVRPGLKGFKIRYGRLQDELQEGFGTVEAVFLYYRVGFGD